MRSTSTWLISLLAMALVLTSGCSRQLADQSSQSGQQNATAIPSDASEQQLPFSGEPRQKAVPSSKSLVPATVTIPAGTPISVRLQTAISSATAHAGDSFEAVLDEPLTLNGRVVAARGSEVRGRVVAARKSGRLHDSGYLRIALAFVTINGRELPVETSSIFVSGGKHKKRNVALIGGGAGAGALVGALAGGGKGALIGGAVGAGAGTGAAYATGKKDVGFGVERRLTFRLTSPLRTRG